MPVNVPPNSGALLRTYFPDGNPFPRIKEKFGVRGYGNTSGIEWFQCTNFEMALHWYYPATDTTLAAGATNAYSSNIPNLLIPQGTGVIHFVIPAMPCSHVAVALPANGSIVEGGPDTNFRAVMVEGSQVLGTVGLKMRLHYPGQVNRWSVDRADAGSDVDTDTLGWIDYLSSPVECPSPAWMFVVDDTTQTGLISAQFENPEDNPASSIYIAAMFLVGRVEYAKLASAPKRASIFSTLNPSTGTTGRTDRAAAPIPDVDG